MAGKVKQRAGFFEEADRALSMRRLAAFVTLAAGVFSLFYCSLADSSLALSAARLAFSFAAVFLGLATSESVVEILKAKGGKDGRE